MKKITALILALSLLLLCSCGAKNTKEKADTPKNDDTNLVSQGEKKEPGEVVKSSEDKMRDFCVELYKKCADDTKNTMISPVSVMLALGMLENGADAETLAEIEKMFGLSRDEANEYLLAFQSAIKSTDDCKISTANSVWLRDEKDRLTVNDKFIEQCKKYFDVGVFAEKFDKNTCKKINKWIEDNTFGLIKNMLDEIPDDAVMYLVNAIGFDAKWAEKYLQTDVCDDKFRTADGSYVDAKYMCSNEYQYISGDGAVGFIKPYKGNKYAFAAILPDEGVTASDYLKTLTGDKLKAILSGASNETVWARLPKFKSEFAITLNDVLAELGMTEAFSADKADFLSMAKSENGNIFVSRVMHKSFIEVAEDGTKAGAATIIEMKEGCALEDEPKKVYLTRPFVYVIFDTESYMPLFIGCENNVAQ